MLGGDQNSLPFSCSSLFALFLIYSDFQRTLSAVTHACLRFPAVCLNPPCLLTPAFLFCFVFCINYFGAKLPIKSKFSRFLLPPRLGAAAGFPSSFPSSVPPFIPFPVGLVCFREERGGLGRDRATFCPQPRYKRIYSSHVLGVEMVPISTPFSGQFFPLLF